MLAISESEVLLELLLLHAYRTTCQVGNPRKSDHFTLNFRGVFYKLVPLLKSGAGDSEILLVNMDVPSQMVNNYGFCLESKLFNNDGQLKGLTIPCQHPINYQAGYNASISMTDNVSPQSILFPKKVSFLQNESNAKKREFFGQKGLQTAPYDVAGDNKRIKVNALEQGLCYLNQQESAGIQDSRLQVPARRSQRLSDKITALQKLVSPYGKTDTASVLQEACLYIKFVQGHIQNLLQMQSSSYKSLKPQGVQQKQGNLRSEGLCLVPVTFTQQIAINREINMIQPHNF